VLRRSNFRGTVVYRLARQRLLDINCCPFTSTKLSGHISTLGLQKVGPPRRRSHAMTIRQFLNDDPRIHVPVLDRRTCFVVRDARWEPSSPTLVVGAVADELLSCLSGTVWLPSMAAAFRSVFRAMGGPGFRIGHSSGFPLPDCMHGHHLAKCPVAAANHWHCDAIFVGRETFISSQNSERVWCDN
jgi:hypothetical protein